MSGWHTTWNNSSVTSIYSDMLHSNRYNTILQISKFYFGFRLMALLRLFHSFRAESVFKVGKPEYPQKSPIVPIETNKTGMP